MKPALLLAAITALLTSPAIAQEAPKWSLAIHGGAGVIGRENLTPEQDAAYRAALARALEAGAAVLDAGGSALDAVQATVELMEDDPLFNAGRGAVFTAAGVNELDAAIMDGETLKAGSVAGLTRTRHPVAAARAVMEQSPHVMLAGEGADVFAASVGVEQVDPSFFFTERRWQALEQTLRDRGDAVPERPAGAPIPGMADLGPQPPLNERKFGTVGAVALDSQGRLAAATSTGGTTGKRWGRIGDAPVIGAGTYASNAEGCAVSATGTGEYFIRATVARDVCGRYAWQRAHPEAEENRVMAIVDTCPPELICSAHMRRPVYIAASEEMREVEELGGDGGVIVMTATGEAWFEMNTPGMYRGQIAPGEAARVAIYGDEAVE